MKVYKTLENGIQFVEYEDSLAPALADMWNKSGDSWGGDNTVMTTEHVIREHAGGSFFNVFVALMNGEAVGYCSFDRYYKDDETAYVHLLNVRPDFHGKKVGKELVLLCVNRTIELGYPRVDIHTWPGNTKAVPLYKKCGFLWEDRADSTHLSNYIPTVLNTELFKEFFQSTKCDWYSDSKRVVEIKPDGQKINKFEVYGYSWEKDGRHLSVGFEKTGRRIRFVETDEYKIEFIAENHELAFGLSYNCVFKVENKTDKPLDIKIVGKNNKEISFDYCVEESVEKSAEFNAQFKVGEVNEIQDIWRMHPCVLCDVFINGKHAEFGLGIEIKFPLIISMSERHSVPRVGIKENLYINIKSSLKYAAKINFSLPQNNITRFFETDYSVNVNPTETEMICAKTEMLKYGYEKLMVTYNIVLENGDEINFTKALHLINQGLEGMFSYEQDNEHAIANGDCRLRLYKDSNHVSFNRLSVGGNMDIMMAKLGKPFDDEFNIAKPSDVRTYKKEGKSIMVLEADYNSTKFEGIVLTEIFEITSSGILSRKHIIKNNSNKAQKIFLQESFWSSIGKRTILHYNGKIHEIKDCLTYGFSNIYTSKIDENWLFDNSPNNLSGVYWPEEYKPDARWGNVLSFEYEAGDLQPGDCYETKPIIYVNNLFGNFNQFRNYVLGINEKIMPYTINHIEIETNAYNPFINNSEFDLAIHNNRLRVLEGEMKIKSNEDLFPEQVQQNASKEAKETNTFNIKPDLNKNENISVVNIDLRYTSFEKQIERALFIKSNSQAIETTEENGIFIVNNGDFSFRASPKYSDAVYSMKLYENEWLFSKYPTPSPYAWWNPFVGGIQSSLPRMSNSLILRENISARFDSVKDKFGNEWSGICTFVDVNEFDEHKGMSYEQYYLTMPGIPVLCYFTKLINKSGGYKDTSLNFSTFLNGKENINDIFAEFVNNERDSFRLRLGSEDDGYSFDRLVKISYAGNCPRDQKLYIFKDTTRDNGSPYISHSVNYVSVGHSSKISLENKSCYTTRPTFFIITEKNLTLDSLNDLERIVF